MVAEKVSSLAFIEDVLKPVILLGLISARHELPEGSMSSIMALVVASLCLVLKST